MNSFLKIFVCVFCLSLSASAGGNVSLLRVPDGGIQPQLQQDKSGAVHLIYFKGAPEAGDVFYVRKNPADEKFSTPMRVNSQLASVIGIGTIRGAHVALGKNGRVHASWMGSKNAEPRGANGATPMLYSRLNDVKTGFEPQRNVVQFATGLDGGGSVAADDAGNVFVAWHADAGAKSEASRRVWLARSHDDGATFEKETPVSDATLGACGCCGMRASASSDGALFIAYRSAFGGSARNEQLLVSTDHGATFSRTEVQKWTAMACPMSTVSFSRGSDVVMSWETSGQIYFGDFNAESPASFKPVAAPRSGNNRKHPVAVRDTAGETLLVWTEGTAWARGGSIVWQVFGKEGNPTPEKGRASGLPAWSLAAAFVNADGSFAIVY